MQSILFTNWTDRVFTHTWDREEFTFQPGQSIYLQDYLAKHFAKHLANRELIRKGKVGDTDYTLYAGSEESLIYKEFRDKALSQPVSAESNIKAEVDVLNRNAESEDKKFCEFCDSKGVKHKKNCPTLNKPVEEEFEGLKENS